MDAREDRVSLRAQPTVRVAEAWVLPHPVDSRYVVMVVHCGEFVIACHIGLHYIHLRQVKDPQLTSQ